MYSQGGMTESPKPLSPAGMQSHQLGHESSMSRQRSPSLTTQFQQQQFGRRPSGRASPTGMSLPSPHGLSQGPKLPTLPGLAPPDSRYTIMSQQSQNGGSPSPSTANSPGTAFQAPRPGHQLSQQQSGMDANVFAGGDRGVWAYCQTLEEKLKTLQDAIATLQNEKKQAADKITSQQDQINRLVDENNYFRNQAQNGQNQSQHSAVSGSS